jgi:hypothetical protein
MKVPYRNEIEKIAKENEEAQNEPSPTRSNSSEWGDKAHIGGRSPKEKRRQ